MITCMIKDEGVRSEEQAESLFDVADGLMPFRP